MNCLNCQKEHNNPKFCSKSCSAKYNNVKFPKRKISRKCIHCDNLVRNYKSLLCEDCNIKRLDKTQKNLKQITIQECLNKIDLDKLHPSSKYVYIRSYARSWFKHLTKLPCANCGYKKHVELCHIKAINSFSNNTMIGVVNSKENIIQLCPNCHWELDHGLLDLSAIQDSNLEPFD